MTNIHPEHVHYYLTWCEHNSRPLNDDTAKVFYNSFVGVFQEYEDATYAIWLDVTKDFDAATMDFLDRYKDEYIRFLTMNTEYYSIVEYDDASGSWHLVFRNYA